VWLDAQPANNSVGSVEFLRGWQGTTTQVPTPTVVPTENRGVLGLSNSATTGALVKIGASVTQASPRATNDPPAPSGIVLSINQGIIAGQGLTLSVDGTAAFKTSLPAASVGTFDSSAAPTFTTITPTLLSASSSASSLSAGGGLPTAQIGTVPLQPPVTAPPPDSNSGAALIDALGSGVAANVANALQNEAETALQATPDTPRPEIGTTFVLGGRGLAQSVDFGRSGGLGGVLSGVGGVDYEVACKVGEIPERDRGVVLQPSRRGPVLRSCR